MQRIIYSQELKSRLDKFVTEYFQARDAGRSRRFFQDKIKTGDILVNGKQVKPDYQLKTGDEVTFGDELREVEVEEVEVKPQKEKLFNLIYEHPDFLVVEKPAGISTHPCPQERFGTLAESLLYYYPEIKGVGENSWRPGIVHRIDKETSGLLIVSRNQKAFQYFKSLFQDRKVEKVYRAVVWGKLKKTSGKIESFIGRSRKDPTKQATSCLPEKLINPKEAITEYKVLEEYGDSSLLEVVLKTGRKHQIRIHLHSIGHPIVGDKKYFNKLVQENNLKYPRHLLHSYKIRFEYMDGEKYEFKSKKTFELEEE
ncbi:MAG: RluA family pseudouridine synthase [Patescibacteria group bacterium]